MKKYLLLILTLAIVACQDTGTSPEQPKPQATGTLVRDTILTNKIIIKKVSAVKNDTDRVTVKADMLIGTMTNTGSAKSVVVCSDLMNTCAKTNKNGVYLLTPKVPVLVAARIAAGMDTVITPDSVSADNLVDTTKTTQIKSGEDTVSDTTSHDTVQVAGTDTLVTVRVTVVDTVYEYDSTQNTVTITEPGTTNVKDTVAVVVDGTVMREVPITSWGHILPVGYVDKWNVEVYDTLTNINVDTVQFVYFATGDSIAQVVTLGREKVGGAYTNRFSGAFFYFWNESAYTKDQYIHNYFIRAKDSTGAIVSKTDVATFSARAFPATVTYLKKNIFVPQHKILPKMVPAAKNNKKLKEATVEYLAVEDTTKNYVGLNGLPYEFETNPVLDAWAIRIKNNTGRFNLDSMGIKRIVFTVTTDADSIFLPGVVSKTGMLPLVPHNKGTSTYTAPVSKGQVVVMFACQRNDDRTTPDVFTDIRFYFD